jgi:hypothetical protein
MAVKHFTGRGLDDPDPECVFETESRALPVLN